MSEQPDGSAAGRMSLKTLPALYRQAFKRYGSAVAMKSRHPWGYQSISYRELGDLVSYVGAGLIAQGLSRGDRVALLAQNCPEWGIVYAAVTSCGMVIVPLDTQLKENEIHHLLIHSESKFLVTSPQIFSDRIEGMHLGGVQTIILGEGDTPQGDSTLGEIMAVGKEHTAQKTSDFDMLSSEVGPDDMAAICYTSGTTGQPKGVVLLHRNIVSDVEATKLRIPYGPDDVFLCILPLYHTLATTCDLLAPIYSGATIIFGRSMKSRDIKEDIERENVTVLVGVPLLFDHFVAHMRARVAKVPKLVRALYRISLSIKSVFGRLIGRGGRGSARKKLDAMGLGSLRFCISGAAALRADTEQVFQQLGLPILQGYGLTEAAPVVSANPMGKIKHGTVGPALPGIEVTIDRPDDAGIGEIVVRGPIVMQGYYKNPDATRNVLHDGRLFTGDLGTVDADGYITILGRKKSVIVTPGGKNIYPDEMEGRLNESPFILESVVLPITDGKGNERVGAIVVPDYDTIGSADQLKGAVTEEGIKEVIASEIKRISADLPDYKHIIDFQIRDEELPRTTTRKLKRHLVTWIKE